MNVLLATNFIRLATNVSVFVWDNVFYKLSSQKCMRLVPFTNCIKIVLKLY